MPSDANTRSNLYYFLTVLIVIAGFAYWASDLTSDPPMYFSGSGQSLATDPYQYVYHARNEVLFGDWTMFDYARWTVYQHSLTSAMAFVVFSVAGVSLASANFIGLLLSMSGLVLLLLGLSRHHRPWLLPLVAAGFVLNVTLLTYGRLSYLENGLIFLSCATFAAYCWWGTRGWGAAICGVLVAAAMLTGKMFGLMLLPAVLAHYYLAGAPDRWKKIGLTIGGFAAAFLILLVVLYGPDLGAAIGYIAEQSYGLHGFPEGLSSPWGFLEKLVSYGFRNLIFYLNPELLLSLLVGGMVLISVLGRGVRWKELSPSTGLLTAWVTLGILGLAPLNYSPLRYSLFFTPALIALPYALIENRRQLKSHGVLRNSPVIWAIAIYIGWVLAFNIGGNIFWFNVPDLPVRLITWSTVAPGLILGWLLVWLFRSGRLRFSRRVLVVTAALVAAVTIVENPFRIYRNHIRDHNFNIKETNADLAQILGPNAVVSGPYAPTLTIDTHLKAFIHLFGVAELDSTLFDRYPITHLACDASNWTIATQDYPQLRDLKPVANYWIRNYEVKIYNISRSFTNAIAHEYKPSQYEIAVDFMHKQQLDSAFYYANRFYSSHQSTKSGGYLIADLLFRAQRTDDAYKVLQQIAENYPTDFYAQIAFGRLTQIIAYRRRDRSLLEQASSYFGRAVAVDPYAGDLANQIWKQTQQRLEAASQNTPAPGSAP